MVKMRVKYHLALIVPRNNVQTHTFSEKVPSNFIFHVVETEASITSFDDYDVLIKQYVDCVSNQNFDDPLLFWNNNEYKFPELARLAKKFLGVPASEAEVERIFNISGRIFNPERRSLGVDNYENLVFLKLNEQFL
jgi:hypothetical protein